MKRLVSAVAVVMSLALAGCGGSLCDDLADATESLGEKAKPCGDGSTTDPITDEEINQCKESLDKCSDSDKEKLGEFVDCINDLPTCSTSNQSAFVNSLLACGNKLEGISAGCGETSSSNLNRHISRLSVSR